MTFHKRISKRRNDGNETDSISFRFPDALWRTAQNVAQIPVHVLIFNKCRRSKTTATTCCQLVNKKKKKREHTILVFFSKNSDLNVAERCDDTKKDQTIGLKRKEGAKQRSCQVMLSIVCGDGRSVARSLSERHWLPIPTGLSFKYAHKARALTPPSLPLSPSLLPCCLYPAPPRPYSGPVVCSAVNTHTYWQSQGKGRKKERNRLLKMLISMKRK